jgi:hypothetical protein
VCALFVNLCNIVTVLHDAGHIHTFTFISTLLVLTLLFVLECVLGIWNVTCPLLNNLIHHHVAFTDLSHFCPFMSVFLLPFDVFFIVFNIRGIFFT